MGKIDLTQIEDFLRKVTPVSSEMRFLQWVWNFAHKHKIPYVNFNTAWVETSPNRRTIVSFDKEGWSNEKTYPKRTDVDFIEMVKTKFVNKKDFIFINQTFWGIESVTFYCSKTNESLRINGYADDIQSVFSKLVNLYHSM